jgi:hypothetical protein
MLPADASDDVMRITMLAEMVFQRCTPVLNRSVRLRINIEATFNRAG